jgi:hypothetical protein
MKGFDDSLDRPCIRHLWDQRRLERWRVQSGAALLELADKRVRGAAAGPLGPQPGWRFSLGGGGVVIGGATLLHRVRALGMAELLSEVLPFRPTPTYRRLVWWDAVIQRIPELPVRCVRRP